MASFEEIDKARKLLGLGEVASLEEIRIAYRRLARRYHPDLGGGDEDQENVIRELNWAYELLEDYSNRYKYTFAKEDVARAYPHEAYLERWREKWPI
jgi:DnaJ-class molecular chaperone